MLGAIGFTAALALIPIQASASDEGALRLKPSSSWRMHYADDSCRIMRTFGEDRNKVAFYFERFEPGDYFAMLAAGRPLRGASRNDIAYVQFGEGHSETKIGFTLGSLADFEPALIFRHTWFNARYVDGENTRKPKTRLNIFDQTFKPEAEQAIDWIAIRRPGRKKVILETGPLGAPMEAMRKCTDDLLTNWGIDLARHRNLARKVKPLSSPSDWISPTDYPKGLFRKGYQGLVHFRLSVDADGLPTACHIQQSTRPEGFDRAVCDAMMRKARFTPAMTKDGDAIASYWRRTVRFEISR